MLKNYLIIAIRNLLKSKVFSLINILGLAIGLAACLLILQYVRFELSYDDFHENADQIYRVSEANDQEDESLLVPTQLGPAVARNYAEVIKAVRMILPWSGLAASSTLSWQNPAGEVVKHSFTRGFYTDPGFTEMFSFLWRRGDRGRALQEPNQIVLSENAARRIFGESWRERDDLIGQPLEYLNEFDRFPLTVSGIIADAPANSHLQYDFLASFATLSTGWARDHIDTWDGPNVYTYLQLSPSASAPELAPRIGRFVAEQSSEKLSEDTEYRLQPLSDIHLYSHRNEELAVNGNATYVTFLSLIAGLILLIALVNYINLTTARAINRGNEVGVRKVMGAARAQLIRQFLLESLLLNALAFGLALTLIQLTIPHYSSLTGSPWDAGGAETGYFLAIFAISTLLSGGYPALIISGYAPLRVLKGKGQYSARGKQLRKGMVLVQFSIALTLIIFTFAAYQQLRHMRSQDPGFDREGVMVVGGPENRTETWIEHHEQERKPDEGNPFIDAVSQYAGVAAVSLSWTVPGEHRSVWTLETGDASESSRIEVLTTDNSYAEVYGLKVLAGEFRTDQGVVINERAARRLGYSEPAAAVGQVFRDQNQNERTIRGVIQDYHHQSLHREIRPLIFLSNDPTYQLDSYYSMKVAGTNLEATVKQIRGAYEKVYPYDPFEYFFIDTYFDAQYREDIRFSRLFGFFAGLAVFIACLGLFGLSLHAVVEKTKEIGIRKVLGATVGNILMLLGRNILVLIGWAAALALPVSYWIVRDWLASYAFRISLSGWLFGVPVLLLLLIVLATVSVQMIRAALANPARSLQHE